MFEETDMGRAKGSHSNAAERLVEAAGRGFRVAGYGGVGVDGLAKEAGLTSGAFYAYFRSAAFHAVVEAGPEDLRSGIRAGREHWRNTWLFAFIDFYLGKGARATLRSPELDRRGDTGCRRDAAALCTGAKRRS
jgi:AcrR family transcriptional regulator